MWLSPNEQLYPYDNLMTSSFEEGGTDTGGQNNNSRLMAVEGADIGRPPGRPIATAKIPVDRKLKVNFFESGDFTVVDRQNSRVMTCQLVDRLVDRYARISSI